MSPNADKTLSPQGLDFIKHAEEEGGKAVLKAYDDGTGTWTLGWGCTKGVTKGMTCTVAEAEAMLNRELGGHIAEVRRLVTRPISQGLFDALVSFFFNLGAGNCQTLLKAVNGGNEDAIRRAWMLYTKAYDSKLGKKVAWPGLVKRRTLELQHWARMDDLDPVVPTPAPPVRLPAPVEPEKPGTIATAASSKSVWMQLQAGALLVLSTFTDWLNQAKDSVAGLLGVVPNASDSIDRAVSTTQQWAAWFDFDYRKAIIPIAIACVGVAMVRHIRDKREAAQ